MSYYKITCKTTQKRKVGTPPKTLYEKQCPKSRFFLRLSSENFTFSHLQKIMTLFSVQLTFTKTFFKGWKFLPFSTTLKAACPDDPISHISYNQSPSTRATMAINGILFYLGFAWEMPFSNFLRTENRFCLPKIWFWIQVSKGNVTHCELSCPFP